MAANRAMDGRYLLKNTKIEVEVVEDLDDLLVVSFDYQDRSGDGVGSTKHFQGVLLNSKKKNWPLGLMAPPQLPGSGHFPPDDGSTTAATAVAESLKKCDDANGDCIPTSMALDSDRLYAVRRRHTYFQSGNIGMGTALAPSLNSIATVGQAVIGGYSMEMIGGNGGARRSTYCRRYGDRVARTMRLRPRQVLCSKCKSICNENSENVQVANTVKAKTISSQLSPPSDTSLRPRQTSMQPKINSCGQTTTTGGRMVLRKRRMQNVPETVAAAAVASGNADPPRPPQPLPSVTDLQPASLPSPVVVPMSTAVRNVENNFDAAAEVPETLKHKKTSPFIKISFGPQGTVIKIPPRTHTYIASDNESDLQEAPTPENCGGGGSSSSPAYRHFRAKAAKKALKKAKKDAQKLGKQAVGANSFASAGSPLRHDPRRSRHHKHKFKHKRRRRDDMATATAYDDCGGSGSNRDDDDDESSVVIDHERRLEIRRRLVVDVGRLIGSPTDDPSSSVAAMNENGTTAAAGELAMPGDRWHHLGSNPEHGGGADDAYSEIKKECLRQKLSISLKRLSEKSYMKCSPTYMGNNGSSNGHREDSNGGGSSGNGAGSNESSEAGDLPEFPAESEPPPMRPLMMRISSYNVTSFTAGDGRVISIGDVVWGKIHGFPWWPGKVLSISVSQRDNGMLVTQQAHVAWFGSSTSSQMPCNQLVPFLEDFKLRYNKKKRGPYKEAIKQATLAAQQVLRSVGQLDAT